MTAKKRFLLRVDPKVYAAVEKWAADELRSVNAQMEYLLAESLKRAGRYPKGPSTAPSGGGAPSEGAPSSDGSPLRQASDDTSADEIDAD